MTETSRKGTVVPVPVGLYCKPTEKHQYLYYTSCHPKHTKNSLPYSLALCLSRICPTEHLFSLRTDEMKQHLLKRGYTKGRQSPICHHIQPSTTKHSKTPTRISDNPKCFRKMFGSFQKYSFSELQEREEFK